MALSNIVLIGFRATGKSEVGQLLARRLGYTFVDTDREVVKRAGMDIAKIFAEKGERHFRDIETTVVLEQANEFGRVIACGGGVVVRPGNVEALKMHGVLFWLTAAAETIYRRMTHDAMSASMRPNLTPLGGLEEIRQMLASRGRHYREAATYTIKTDDKTPRQIVEDIVRKVKLKVQAAQTSGLSFQVIDGDPPSVPPDPEPSEDQAEAKPAHDEPDVEG